MRLEWLAGEGRVETAGQATYGMSNLRPESTGLPFIVSISQKDDARHAARVKWSPQPKVERDALGSYAISPFEHEAGPRLGSEDEVALARWIDANRDVLQRYWDGDMNIPRMPSITLRRFDRDRSARNRDGRDEV